MDQDYLNSLFNTGTYGPLNQAFQNELGPNAAPLGAALNPISTSQTSGTGALLDAAGNPVRLPGQPGVSPEGGDQGTMPAGGAAASGTDGLFNSGPQFSKFAQALRGVQAPAAPRVQTVATPHAPPIRPIQSGQLVNMLAALGVGPRDALQLPTLRQNLAR